MATQEELKKLLRNGTRQNMIEVTTPSTVLFCELQNLKCQYTQDVCMIVGAITVVGLYFAIKSIIEKHYVKKVAIERAENILNIHEGIRNKKKSN